MILIALRVILIGLAIYLSYYFLIKRPARKYKEQMDSFKARRQGRIVEAEFEVKKDDSDSHDEDPKD